MVPANPRVTKLRSSGVTIPSENWVNDLCRSMCGAAIVDPVPVICWHLYFVAWISGSRRQLKVRPSGDQPYSEIAFRFASNLAKEDSAHTCKTSKTTSCFVVANSSHPCSFIFKRFPLCLQVTCWSSYFAQCCLQPSNNLFHIWNANAHIPLYCFWVCWYSYWKNCKSNRLQWPSRSRNGLVLNPFSWMCRGSQLHGAYLPEAWLWRLLPFSEQPQTKCRDFDSFENALRSHWIRSPIPPAFVSMLPSSPTQAAVALKPRVQLWSISCKNDCTHHRQTRWSYKANDCKMWVFCCCFDLWTQHCFRQKLLTTNMPILRSWCVWSNFAYQQQVSIWMLKN
jgi:hypothetical protein